MEGKEPAVGTLLISSNRQREAALRPIEEEARCERPQEGSSRLASQGLPGWSYEAGVMTSQASPVPQLETLLSGGTVPSEALLDLHSKMVPKQMDRCKDDPPSLILANSSSHNLAMSASASPDSLQPMPPWRLSWPLECVWSHNIMRPLNSSPI